jgi:hypothetical protein
MRESIRLDMELTTRLELAKVDRHTMDDIIRAYTPFIKKCVSGVFFEHQSREDNLTIAMLAFA